jgi:hypothetical protein
MPSFFSQLAHSNLSHPLFRNPDRIPDCPKRRARFPCPRNRPVTTDSARNLLLQPPDHCALDACALFRACGSPGTRLFLLAYVRGIRKRRPTQAMQPSQHRASARSELLRDLRCRKSLSFQVAQPFIPLRGPETPRYPPHLSHARPLPNPGAGEGGLAGHRLRRLSDARVLNVGAGIEAIARFVPQSGKATEVDADQLTVALHHLARD